MVAEESIDRMIEYAVINRFNNIVVQVRGRGDAFYNSAFVPKSSLIKNVDFDPLAYLIPKAKQKGLKVHVWLNTYLLWSSSVMPIQKDHLIHTRKDWIDSNTTSPLNIMGELKKVALKVMALKGFIFHLDIQTLTSISLKYLKSWSKIMISMVCILITSVFTTQDTVKTLTL